MSEADTRGAHGHGKDRASAGAGVPAARPTNSAASSGPAPATPDTVREQEQQPERESALVLIVEDEQPIAEALSYMVEDAGYTVLIASHGQQGLDIARARRPALIFTDLMMPRMDGTALIAALRDDAAKDGSSPAPPIILMTAAGFNHAQRAGADAILAKPFDITDIERLLARFLNYRNP